MPTTIYTINFNCITVTKDPISYNSLIDYKSFANHTSLLT